jgi:DNA-binding transcriptional regulator YhcF (GntR family)
VIKKPSNDVLDRWIGENPQVTALLNWLHIDRNSNVAIYNQIANQMRDAILVRDLIGGAVLPSTRALTADLSVGRVTVLQGYEVLTAERMIETRQGARTRVAPDLSGSQLRNKARARYAPPTPIDRETKHLEKLYELAERTNIAFQPGIPAFDAFPRALWSRLLAGQALSADQHLLDYAHVGGYPPRTPGFKPGPHQKKRPPAEGGLFLAGAGDCYQAAMARDAMVSIAASTSSTGGNRLTSLSKAR